MVRSGVWQTFQDFVVVAIEATTLSAVDGAHKDPRGLWII